MSLRLAAVVAGVVLIVVLLDGRDQAIDSFHVSILADGLVLTNSENSPSL